MPATAPASTSWPRASWRAGASLTTAQIEDAGQQEFLNWVCLGGAMHALGREPVIVDYVESYIFNSDKCFALFPAVVPQCGRGRTALAIKGKSGGSSSRAVPGR